MWRMLRWMVVLIILLAAGLGGGYLWIEHAALTPMASEQPEGENPLAGPGVQKEFLVAKGATLNEVGRHLETAGFIKHAQVWRLYARMHGSKPLQAGRHSISPAMNIPQLLEALASTPLSDDVAVTIVEGWRLSDTDQFLTQAHLVEPGAYIKSAHAPRHFQIPFPFEGDSLEGYLWPETYMVPPGKLDIDRLIQRQIDAFAHRFYAPNQAEIGQRPLRAVVTIASMLEREEPNPSQRPYVAGVMYKRLDANTPLGIDATSRYHLRDWNDRAQFLKALRNPTDPYNTRLRPGLPPSPIGAPGLSSLLAAIRPKSSAYWYYLHDSERRVHFARTAAEHEANRKKYRIY